MRGFVEWMQDPEKGFYVRESWSEEKGKMVHGGKLKLIEHQNVILGHALTPNEDGDLPYTTVVFSCIKKSGKALALDTPIPTPNGWTTMGEIQEGDSIFDEHGNEVMVSFVTDVMYDHPCYSVEFSDGTSITADEEHVWTVYERNQGTGKKRNLTTKEMYDKGVLYDSNSGLRRFSIKTDYPIQTSEKDLPMSPYLLGAWLGDGASKGSRITCGEEDIDEMLSLLSVCGFPAKILRPKGRSPEISLGGKRGGSQEQKSRTFLGVIRSMGLYGNKHIPQEYLRASMKQRLELLRGLMDTDGYISTKGRCEFTTTSQVLASQMKELLRTIGIKARITSGRAMLDGRYMGVKYRIHFSPDYFDAFYLKRKRERGVIKNETARSRYVRIVSIEPVDSVPVRCIQVNSGSHLYLAGEGMIPTHNTAIGAAVGAWYADEGPEGTEIYVLANSLEHAEGRVMKDLKFHYEKIPGVKITAYRIELPNGTFIQALGQAYKSVAGSRHALTIWDELWGSVTESDIRVWDEMTPIPTIPNSLQFIATYAGFRNESQLLWDVYIQGVGPELEDKGQGTLLDLDGLPCWKNETASQFTYWDSERRMPWQTEDYYARQEAKLRPAAFLRLHMNQWVTTHEEFIPVSWFDEAAEHYEADADLWSEHPFRHWPVYVGVDAGVKRDCTAIVVVGYDAERARLGIVRHKIWKPVEGEWFDLDATVEKYLRDLYNRYRVASIVYDRTQLHQTMTRLHYSGFPVKEFSQASKMIAASQLLYDLFKDKKVEAYQDEELRKHIQMARAEVTANGFKISKSRTDRALMHHDDAAVALAMAAYEAITEGGVDISVPIILSSPFSDMQEIDTSEDAWMPFPLRSDN